MPLGLGLSDIFLVIRSQVQGLLVTSHRGSLTPTRHHPDVNLDHLSLVAFAPLPGSQRPGLVSFRL